MWQDTKIWMWCLGMLVVSLIVLGGLRLAGIPLYKMVERKTLVESHQYKEGMNQRAAVLRANITELDEMIRRGEGDINSLQSQKRVLYSQLNAITLIGE